MVTRWVSQRSTDPTSFVLQFAEGFPRSLRRRAKIMTPQSISPTMYSGNNIRGLNPHTLANQALNPRNPKVAAISKYDAIFNTIRISAPRLGLSAPYADMLKLKKMVGPPI